MNRRRFLRISIAGAALLGGAATIGRHLSGYRLDAAVAGKLRVLTPKEYLVLRAAARRLLAVDGPDAPDPDRLEVALFADAYLAKLPAPMQTDVKALLQLLEHGGLLFSASLSRFTHLAPEAQDRTLADWESSRLAVRRQGFQALKTLALLGYYRHDETWPLLGYTGPMLPRPT